MQSIDADYRYRRCGVVYFCQSVCVLVTTAGPAKTAEPIEMLCWEADWLEPKQPRIRSPNVKGRFRRNGADRASW